MFHTPAHKQGSLKAGNFVFSRVPAGRPSYEGKLWEDMTLAEQEQFKNDMEDAHYAMLDAEGPEFPRGEFAFN